MPLIGNEYLDDMKKWGRELPADSADVGQPEEIAGLVSYLASKESKFVTGNELLLVYLNEEFDGCP